MLYSLLVIGGIGLAAFYYKRWKALPSEKRDEAGKKYTLFILIAILLIMVATGRAHWLMGLLAGLLAIASRAAQLVQYVPLFKKIYDHMNGNTGQNGRTAQGGQSAPNQQGMSRQEAADILGVDVNAPPEDVRTAHKKLMQKIHPDRGGSDALAKQINQAKTILMG